MATKIVQPKVKTSSGFDNLVIQQAQNATNANVTNLNTESNAVVNFQIGTGTAYSKTINNVNTALKANSIAFTTEEPTASPTDGTLIIYVGSSVPTTRYDRVIYIITST